MKTETRGDWVHSEFEGYTELMGFLDQMNEKEVLGAKVTQSPDWHYHLFYKPYHPDTTFLPR